MIVDITVPLRDALAHYPDNVPFSRTVDRSVAHGDRSTNSHLRLGSHTGTHMDAPIHFVAGGAGAHAIDLDACIGPCVVADLTSVPGAISASDLEAAGIPPGTRRLLAKTRNSPWADDPVFREDFCAYDATAARWCVDRGLRLVAIDYLSIEPFGSSAAGNPTHTALLGAGIAVLEGVDLDGVEPGGWDLVVLPLAIEDGDGAPARAILRR